MAILLIADDSWIARLKIGKILKAAGYQVVEAKDGEETLEILETIHIDLLLLDLLMPKKTGTEVLQEIQGKYPFPVIVLTADIQDSTREECFRMGAKEVLNKPPTESMLLQTISKYIGKEGDK